MLVSNKTQGVGVRTGGRRHAEEEEEAHTEEALRSSEQPKETAGCFLAGGLQLVNRDRRNSGREPLW